MEGVPNYKMGAADFQDAPAGKFLHGAIVLVNSYQHTKNQISTSYLY